MTEDEKSEVMTTVDSEGFDYAFCDYSNFDEIKDEEFHKLRKEFKEASKKLKTLIGFYEW